MAKSTTKTEKKTTAKPGEAKSASKDTNWTIAVEQLQAMLEADDYWLWETDTEHRYTWFSSNFSKVTGADTKNLIGQSRIGSLTAKAYESDGFGGHLRKLSAREPFSGFRCNLSGGKLRQMLSGVPIFDDEGTFTGYHGTGKLVSGGASKKLTGDGEELANTIVASLSVGVVVFDDNDQIVLCNERVRELFPKIADVLEVDCTLRDVIEASHKAEQLLLAEKHRKFIDKVGLEKAIDIEVKSFRNAEFEQTREHGLADGRWIRLTNQVLDNGFVVVVAVDISETKDHENDSQLWLGLLEEFQRRQEYILDAIPAGIIVYDKDNRFVLANKIVRESLPKMVPAMQPGKSIREALELAHDAGYMRITGDSEIDALYDTDREEWLKRYEKRYDEKYLTYQRVEPDGRCLQAIDTRTDDGTLVGVRLDVTELKNTEAAAEAANSRLQNAIDSLKDGFVIWDENDRLVVCNKAFRDQMSGQMNIRPGRTYKELLDELAATGKVEDAVDREAEWVQDLIDRREEELDKEIVFKTHDGRWVMRRDQMTQTGDRVGVRTDITEVKRSEEQLIAARGEMEQLLEDFRTLVDTLEMGVVLLDRDLKVEIINKAFYSIWKVTPEEVGVDNKFRDLMDVNRNNGIYDVADKDWEQYVKTRCDEIRAGDVEPRFFERADGKTLIYSVTALSGGKRLVTYFDVSEQRQREAALGEAERKAILADRAKSEFLANMSHEIRTPMNGVLGMAELLAKSDLDPKQRTFTDIIVKSGNALLTIINDILDFSKIDAGQLVLDPAPFKLAEAIEDVATLVSTRAKEKDLELIVRVQPGLPEMMIGDVGRIRQIITNLMGNAVKFTERGHVLVDVTGEVGKESTKLKIAVTDTGIGIPDVQLKTVFEKFNQVDTSSTRRHEGTGLGLTITSKLVELMNGDIGVESEFGKGSTFWVTIELQNSGNQSNKKVAPVDVTGARVLIIDDNAVNRSILLEQTNSWALDSCAADSGEVGLLVMQSALKHGLKVECLILDYQMPGMSGFQVAKAVREDKGLSDTPIIMLTSVDQILSSKEYRELGINAHLVKPARSSQLLETIVDLVHAHRDKSLDVGKKDEEIKEPPEVAQEEQAENKDGDEKETGEARKKAGSDSGGVDILVAEDNEVNQIVFSQILGETDHSFEIVDNGRKAVEAHEELKPRMILMDVSMPEMSGLEATEAIREKEAELDTRTPIIGVTAHALKGDRERCLEAGMDDYMSKPISPHALQAMIEKWLIEADANKKRETG